MSKVVLTDLSTLQTQRNAINANFTELYSNVFPSIAERTASFTLALADIVSTQKLNHATVAIVVTIPLNSVVAFPIGSEIVFFQYGDADCSFLATGGVTIRSDSSALKIAGKYTAATLLKIGTDEWLLAGAIAV